MREQPVRRSVGNAGGFERAIVIQKIRAHKGLRLWLQRGQQGDPVGSAKRFVGRRVDADDQSDDRRDPREKGSDSDTGRRAWPGMDY